MTQRKRATGAEMTAWGVFAFGMFIAGIAYLGFLSASDDVHGDASAPFAWMIAGAALASAAFVPAIILTGLRQLVPALRGVDEGERRSADREDGAGDREDVAGDIGRDDPEHDEQRHGRADDAVEPRPNFG